jgi:hypothetical protein
MKRSAAIVGILLEDEEEFDAHDDLVNSYGVDAVCRSLGFEWLKWNVYYKEIGPWRVYFDPDKKNNLLNIEVGYYHDGDQSMVFGKDISLTDGYVAVQAVVDYLSKVKVNPSYHVGDINAAHIALAGLLHELPAYDG